MDEVNKVKCENEKYTCIKCAKVKNKGNIYIYKWILYSEECIYLVGVVLWNRNKLLCMKFDFTIYRL